MYDYKDVIEGVAISAIIFIITILLIYFIKKLSTLVSWFRRKIPRDKSISRSQQTDANNMKDTVLKVAHNWMEMKKLLEKVRNNQDNFVNCLQNRIEIASEKLGWNIIGSLEEESLRNDQKFAKIKRTIEAMHEDIVTLKISLQTFHKRSLKLIECEKTNKGICIDNFSQTEYEIKKRVKDRHTKIGNESETLKLANIVKKCLTDLMKDTKLQLSVDQEEENRELQMILAKLAEDREDIKKTIIQAFSIATEQAKRNFDQFGHIGQDAMNYIAVLSENTKMLKIKLEKTDTRLKEILSAADRQKFDVNAIKEALEKMYGQFDQIFKSVELGSQRNTEHCEELALNLEKSSSNWTLTAAELEKVTRNLSNNTKQIQEMLKELVISLDLLKPVDNKQNRERSEIMQYDSTARETTEDLRILSQKQKSLMLIFSMIESCWENMTCMNNRVEKGCQNLCNLIDGLEHNLKWLNDSVGRLDQVLRGVNLESFCSGLKCHNIDSEEIIENLMNSTVGDAGDGQPQISKNRNTQLNETNIQKVRLAINKEVTIIELILKKVCENIKKTEVSFNATHTANVTEEPSNSYMETYEDISYNFQQPNQDDSKNVSKN